MGWLLDAVTCKFHIVNPQCILDVVKLIFMILKMVDTYFNNIYASVGLIIYR